jgi:predicted nicotinamide N-methyase
MSKGDAAHDADEEAAFLWQNGLFANEEPAVAAAPASPPLEPIAKEKGMDVVFVFGDHRVVCPRLEEASAHISARVWRGGLLLASFIDSHREILTQNATVLEVGCGRGLVGMLAKALAGHLLVMLTDCDDRALVVLRPLANVAHFVWEEDLPENVGMTVRHWSDVYRAEREIPPLAKDAQFDVILAAECLYFACQEDPLAHAICRRLKKGNPKAVALAVVQRRGDDAGFQLERFRGLLLAAGLEVEQSDGPWQWGELLRKHVHLIPGQEGLELGQTMHEVGDPALLIIRWPLLVPEKIVT